jgi:hypothetical protein
MRLKIMKNGKSKKKENRRKVAPLGEKTKTNGYHSRQQAKVDMRKAARSTIGRDVGCNMLWPLNRLARIQL